MKAPTPRFSTCTAAAIALLGLGTGAAAADADDLSTRLAKHPEACANMTVNMKDLRLAMKALEGESAFLQYVRFRRPHEHWTMEEAINRANAAAVTRCGMAIGLKAIDETTFPNVLIGERAND